MKQPQDNATRELPAIPPAAERQRLSLDLTPTVSALLDHVANVTGVPKSQLAVQALLDALPAALERAEGLQKRHNAIQSAPRPGQKR